MSHTAFFYGTLMAPPVLHRVIWGSPRPPTPAHASLLRIRPAMLHAHQRRKVRGADYPGLVPVSPSSERQDESEASVRGTLVQGLTDGDMWRLDVFEGSEYVRRKVRVRVLLPNHQDAQVGGGQGGMGDLAQEEEDNVEGEQVEAETYIWVAGEHRLQGEEWDFKEFVGEKMGRWVGGVELEDVDNAVAAAQGDPTGGRGANGDITRQLNRESRATREILESAV